MTDLALRYCGLTLDEFARITGISPCVFYGISPETPYDCKVWTCRERQTLVNAIVRAQQMIEEKVYGKFCDFQKTLKAQSHYFSIPSDWLLETRRTVAVTMTVTIPEPPGDPLCETLVTLEGEIVIEECETIVGVDIAQDKCLCPRLPAEFCRAEYEVTSVDPDTGAQTIALTLVTAAYNLNDSTTIVDGTTLDWLPEEIDLNVVVALPEKEARVYWQPRPGCCPAEDETCDVAGCCHLQICCGCLQRSPTGIANVLDWNNCCVQTTCCNPFPHHFEIDVVVPGVWKPAWSEAVVSLANQFLPQDYCTCNPLASLRYLIDTGKTEDTIAKPQWLFQNPWGIYTPGAKAAWGIVSGESLKTTIFSI